MNKRFLKEIRDLCIEQSQKDIIQNDYLIYFDESNINNVHAIIKAPYDSIYRHKFIRLDFVIPDNYPHSPPQVTFVKYDNVRIHPNMYENGKCCATILNTWGDDQLEKWTSSMGIETILLTFHSFLDNNPYMYEPGGRDDSSYSVYVQYQSWITCLLNYLQNEKIPLFNEYIHTYMLLNIDNIFNDLDIQNSLYPPGYYYSRCFEIENYLINYSKLSETLQNYYNYIDFTQNVQVIQSDSNITFSDFCNKEYGCHICFDTSHFTKNEEIILSCKHSFHKECISEHIKTNSEICPVCRRGLPSLISTSTETIINPETRRRIRVGGKVYSDLKKRNVI
jgi:ubiquitin-protein ligase